MELFFIGVIISGFGVWCKTSFASALLTWGIGISLVGIGFMLCEKNIWDYISEQVKKFERSE